MNEIRQIIEKREKLVRERNRLREEISKLTQTIFTLNRRQQELAERE